MGLLTFLFSLLTFVLALDSWLYVIFFFLFLFPAIYPDLSGGVRGSSFPLQPKKHNKLIELTEFILLIIVPSFSFEFLF
jgi:hypothetical protein